MLENLAAKWALGLNPRQAPTCPCSLDGARLPQGGCVNLLGLPNKVPQTGWLKTTEVCCPTVLEAWCLRSGVGRATLPPKPGAPFLALPAAGGGCQSLACICVTPSSASVVTWPSPFSSVCLSKCPTYKNTSHLGLRAHPNDFILTWLHLQRLYSQIRAHSEVLGLGLQCIFFGATAEPVKWVSVQFLALNTENFCSLSPGISPQDEESWCPAICLKFNPRWMATLSPGTKWAKTQKEVRRVHQWRFASGKENQEEEVSYLPSPPFVSTEHSR